MHMLRLPRHILPCTAAEHVLMLPQATDSVRDVCCRTDWQGLVDCPEPQQHSYHGEVRHLSLQPNLHGHWHI